MNPDVTDMTDYFDSEFYTQAMQEKADCESEMNQPEYYSTNRSLNHGFSMQEVELVIGKIKTNSDSDSDLLGLTQ